MGERGLGIFGLQLEKKTIPHLAHAKQSNTPQTHNKIQNPPLSSYLEYPNSIVFHDDIY